MNRISNLLAIFFTVFLLSGCEDDFVPAPEVGEEKAKVVEEKAEPNASSLADAKVADGLTSMYRVFIDHMNPFKPGRATLDFNLPIKLFTEAIQLDPSPRLAHVQFHIGICYEQMGNDAQAQFHFDQAKELGYEADKKEHVVTYGFDNLSRFYKPFDNYNNANELEINSKVVYINRGRAYLELGLAGKAIADFDKAIELDPNDITAYFNRGKAYSQNTRAYDHEKAIADYSKVIELDPNDASTYNNRGEVYAKWCSDRAADGDAPAEEVLAYFEKAIADFTKAIELDPTFAVAYYARGFVFQELGKTGKAKLDFAKAEELGYEPE